MVRLYQGVLAARNDYGCQQLNRWHPHFWSVRRVRNSVLIDVRNAGRDFSSRDNAEVGEMGPSHIDPGRLTFGQMVLSSRQAIYDASTGGQTESRGQPDSSLLLERDLTLPKCATLID